MAETYTAYVGDTIPAGAVIKEFVTDKYGMTSVEYELSNKHLVVLPARLHEKDESGHILPDNSFPVLKLDPTQNSEILSEGRMKVDKQIVSTKT